MEFHVRYLVLFLLFLVRQLRVVLDGKSSQEYPVNPLPFCQGGYGISCQIFGLISSFLSKRQLRVVLDGKSSQEYPVNAGVSQGSILSPTLFLLHINDPPDDVICDTAIYPDDTTLYSSVMRHMICGNNLNWFLNLNLIYETLWTWTKRGLLISMLGKLS